MSPFWPRYPRDLEGAWHAIDDLRDHVEKIEVRAVTLWQVVAFTATAAAVVSAVAAILH